MFVRVNQQVNRVNLNNSIYHIFKKMAATSSDIKNSIQNNLDNYSKKILKIQQCLNDAIIPVHKPILKSINVWYGGPDHISIKLNASTVTKIIETLIKKGHLGNSVKLGISWRIYTGAVEIQKGVIKIQKYKYQNYDCDPLITKHVLSDKDIEVVEGTEVKNEIIKYNGKIYTRVPAKIIEYHSEGKESRSS